MQLIVRLIICSFLLVSATALAADSPSSPTNEPKFLFIIDAKQSQLTRVGDKQYQLTIPHTAMQSVQAFTAPPNHQSFPLSPQAYRQFVYTGKNSFQTDPPNVMLNWPQQNKKGVYTLSKHQVLADRIVYTLIPVGADNTVIKQTNGPVLLLVDARGCKTVMNVVRCIGGAGSIDGMACRSYAQLPTCPVEQPPRNCPSPFGIMACRTGATNWHGIPCRYYLSIKPC